MLKKYEKTYSIFICPRCGRLRNPFKGYWMLCNKCEREMDAERFDYKCPYTDKHCKKWNCSHCRVEKEEREMMR